jgi:hypothetical protein
MSLAVLTGWQQQKGERAAFYKNFSHFPLRDYQRAGEKFFLITHSTPSDIALHKCIKASQF